MAAGDLDPLDLTLPALNVKFDYPSEDLEGGGPKQRLHEDLAAFKKRVSYLRGVIDHDAEVISKFAAQADVNIGRLHEILATRAAT